VKEEFMPRKKKVYLLSREKREEMYKFIEEKTLEVVSNGTSVSHRKE